MVATTPIITTIKENITALRKRKNRKINSAVIKIDK
jgi:hypothetical protein